MGSSPLAPIPPEGRSLVSICVAVVMFVLAAVTVCMRLWLRAWRARASCLWGWEDILALAGLLLYGATSALVIVGNCFGFGVPPDRLADEAYISVGLKYFTLAEMTYCACSASIKASIGIALARTVCVQRRYRCAVWLTIAVSTAAFLGALVWFLASCQPVAAAWDPDPDPDSGPDPGPGAAAAGGGGGGGGRCRYGGYLPLVYVTFSVAVATDVAFAAVPLLALRRLRMPRRTKYPLMTVFSLGGLAAVASVGRFPFVPNMADRFSAVFLYENTWIGLLSVLECGIGLIAGSMPFLGRLFHLYESSSADPEAPRDDAARPTIGGIPCRVVNESGSISLFSMTAETRQGSNSCTKLAIQADHDEVGRQRSCTSNCPADTTQPGRGI